MEDKDKIIDINSGINKAENQVSVKSGTEIEYSLVKQEGDNKFEYRIWTSADPIIDLAEQKIEAESENLEMSGFQKGRVPKNIARKHLGEKILTSIIDRKIAQMLQYVIKKENLTISSPPGIDVEEFEKGKKLSCYVKFEIVGGIPPIDLLDPIFNDRIEILSLNVIEDDINKAIETLKNISNDYVETDPEYQAIDGDKLIIDFDGRIDSKPFDGGSGSGVELIIGSNQFIKDFEDQLIGVKVNESKIIKVRFPDDYHIEENAGKDCIFKVTVSNIKKAESTEFNDEFARSLGLENTDQFREMISERLKADFTFLSRLYAKKQLFEVLDEIIKMDDIPPSMIEIDFKSLWSEVMPKISNDKKENRDEMAVKIMNIARRRVKVGLVLAEIAKKYSIEVNDEDVEDYKQLEILRNPGDSQKIQEQYEDKKNLPKIEATVLEEKVITFIFDCFKTKEITVTSQQFNEEYASKLQDII
ncbi:trigger factor [Lyticum sinuosum]|uniref:Trigger factor n=1 Tax=Lyticum sinuosum TaxID=1332059 RepID=A0AAE4VLH3_9RICK|nr:trigger factor [Lyticum sinuosum]MDZ5760976.1 Trigger factor [Lyticum sinuosum]